MTPQELHRRFINSMTNDQFVDFMVGNPQSFTGLSPRRFEVACLSCEGLCVKEIAWKLKIDCRTASSHIVAVYRYFGIRKPHAPDFKSQKWAVQLLRLMYRLGAVTL